MSSTNTGQIQPPPRHPATTGISDITTSGASTATPHSASNTVSGGVKGQGHQYGTVPGNTTEAAPESAGHAAADKIKGAWNTIHGSGEVIRGQTNALLDNVGETIANRGEDDRVPTRSRDDPSQTAAQGVQEFQKGVQNLKH